MAMHQKKYINNWKKIKEVGGLKMILHSIILIWLSEIPNGLSTSIYEII